MGSVGFDDCSMHLYMSVGRPVGRSFDRSIGRFDPIFSRLIPTGGSGAAAKAKGEPNKPKLNNFVAEDSQEVRT